MDTWCKCTAASDAALHSPCSEENEDLGGGLKHFLYSSLFGEMIQFDWFFSDGSVQPPTRDRNRQNGGLFLSQQTWKLPWRIPHLPSRSSSVTSRVHTAIRRNNENRTVTSDEDIYFCHRTCFLLSIVKSSRSGTNFWKNQTLIAICRYSPYPWTPKPWKMKVLNPQYMGYNP